MEQVERLLHGLPQGIVTELEPMSEMFATIVDGHRVEMSLVTFKRGAARFHNTVVLQPDSADSPLELLQTVKMGLLAFPHVQRTPTIVGKELATTYYKLTRGRITFPESDIELLAETCTVSTVDSEGEPHETSGTAMYLGGLGGVYLGFLAGSTVVKSVEAQCGTVIAHQLGPSLELVPSGL